MTSTSMAASEHYLAVLKASYDYDPDPSADDEIAIKENQILFLKERFNQEYNSFPLPHTARLITL
ncbi:hypothetical protein GGX14DRAFT_414337 [Mycena pura]|uniref:Uncharacterized protein n=1 Tax=Mycena pura TaxID=153505 RepID=A0AAD7E4N7_9AGAR|nr:hypothetical protein GGX14DRAFT_414337 [Mycena pura]